MASARKLQIGHDFHTKVSIIQSTSQLFNIKRCSSFIRLRSEKEVYHACKSK